MSFLYLFDKVDFENDGQVCATKQHGLEETRSNFLYLVSKYNQAFLQENGESIPEFFKSELNKVLEDVEKGGDFSKAKSKVLENCCEKVQKLAKTSKTEKEFVSSLNDNVSLKDKSFAESLKKVDNNKHLEYIITFFSGKLFEKVSIQSALGGADMDKKEKSNLYKDMIKYNSLVAVTDKIKDNSYSLQDIKTMVS